MSEAVTKEKLDRLEELAKKATPGPWLEREDFDYYQGGTYLGVDPYSYDNGKTTAGFKKNVCRIGSGEPDKLFIAATNPTEVLSLIAEIRRLREIVEDLSQGNRMSETEGTLLAKFGKLRERARAALSEGGG